MLAAVLLVVLAVGAVVYAVVMSRRPVVLARPDGMGGAPPSVMRTHGLSVTRFYEVEAAVQRVEPPRPELFPAAQQLARQQLDVPEPTSARTIARLQGGLGAVSLVAGLTIGSSSAVVYGVVYSLLGAFTLALTIPQQRRRRERLREVFRTDELDG